MTVKVEIGLPAALGGAGPICRSTGEGSPPADPEAAYRLLEADLLEDVQGALRQARVRMGLPAALPQEAP